MQTLTFPSVDSSETEVNPALNVVIAYQDLETGKRAMKTYDYMIEHLGSQCLFTNQMWKFDVLNIPKLREMAAKDAAGADIVIISCHARSELAPEVRAWIELWLAEKNEAIAIAGNLKAYRAICETPRAERPHLLSRHGRRCVRARRGIEEQTPDRDRDRRLVSGISRAIAEAAKAMDRREPHHERLRCGLLRAHVLSSRELLSADRSAVSTALPLCRNDGKRIAWQ